MGIFKSKKREISGEMKHIDGEKYEYTVTARGKTIEDFDVREKKSGRLIAYWKGEDYIKPPKTEKERDIVDSVIYLIDLS